MFCANCGTESCDGTNFCMKCGTALDNTVSDKNTSGDNNSGRKTIIAVIVLLALWLFVLLLIVYLSGKPVTTVLSENSGRLLIFFAIGIVFAVLFRKKK